MNRVQWSEPVDTDTAHRRASGRRHYNTWRQLVAILRRWKVAAAFPFRHGKKAALGRQLGVSRSTICRDFKKVLEAVWAHRDRPPRTLKDLKNMGQSDASAWLMKQIREEADRLFGWPPDPPSCTSINEQEQAACFQLLIDELVNNSPAQTQLERNQSVSPLPEQPS